MKNGTLYIGVTSDLLKRVVEHKTKQMKGFTEEHDIDRLVWFEQTESIEGAIKREKQMKKWKRQWKIREIEKVNPDWNDLFYEIGGSDELLEAVKKQLKEEDKQIQNPLFVTKKGTEKTCHP
jgi:putative endonuclease